MLRLEQISALLDDAGSPEDLAALPQIAADRVSRAAWARFQAQRDLMDDTDHAYIGDSLQRRVAAALENEPTPAAATATVVPMPLPQRRWSGLAIAASVLLAAMTGWYLQSSLRPEAGALVPSLAKSIAPASASAGRTAPAASSAALAPLPEPVQVSSLPPEEYQRRINSYLVNFNEQRAQMGVPGVPPYVRVVGLESAPQR